jgi:hypothetical protein
VSAVIARSAATKQSSLRFASNDERSQQKQRWENEIMMLKQSYVLLVVTIVVVLINFLGAYFTVRKARAKRATQ